VNSEPIRDLEDLRQLREQIFTLARQHRVIQISVFGSVARGDTHADSDVDLLVDFEPGYRLTDHIRLLQGLKELLNCSVDVVDRRALRPEFREFVLAEVQPL